MSRRVCIVVWSFNACFCLSHAVAFPLVVLCYHILSKSSKQCGAAAVILRSVVSRYVGMPLRVLQRATRCGDTHGCSCAVESRTGADRPRPLPVQRHQSWPHSEPPTSACHTHHHARPTPHAQTAPKLQDCTWSVCKLYHLRDYPRGCKSDCILHHLWQLNLCLPG